MFQPRRISISLLGTFSDIMSAMAPFILCLTVNINVSIKMYFKIWMSHLSDFRNYWIKMITWLLNYEYIKVKEWRGHELYATLSTGWGPCPDILYWTLKSANSVRNINILSPYFKKKQIGNKWTPHLGAGSCPDYTSILIQLKWIYVRCRSSYN